MVAIIYNWKGLKEENYLYTDAEMEKFDSGLLAICKQYKDTTEWFDSTLAECPWKTWMGMYINDDEIEEIKKFLSGVYNEAPHQEYLDNNDIDPENDDWYWENVPDNDLYGYPSDTLKKYLEVM